MADLSVLQDTRAFNPLAALRAVLDSDLDANSKLVATVLIRHGGESGMCYPSLARIMAQSSLSRSAVKRAIRTLETAGVVAVTRPPGAVNQYCILVEPDVCESADSHETGFSQALGSHETRFSGNPDRFPQNLGRFSQNRPVGFDRTPEIPIGNNQLNTQRNTHLVGARKRRARGETDSRVQPILQAFREAYMNRVGKEPTRTVLDWARDGKRIRELPGDYTSEDLTAALVRFFDPATPGFISRNLRFADFITALPRLLQSEPSKAERPRRVRYVESNERRDYSDYFCAGEEG